MKTSHILLITICAINVTFASECHFDLPGDLNNDCKTDFLDFAIVANTWLIDCGTDLGNANCLPLDLDGDGGLLPLLVHVS
jgi:hypothetical protein